MARSSRRSLVIVGLIFLLLLLLLFVRCNRTTGPNHASATPVSPKAVAQTGPRSSVPPTHPLETDERLTPATIQAPAEVGAGAVFPIGWTGPDNAGDYITMVAKEAPDGAYAAYVQTKEGPLVKLIAPIEAGFFELRYMAARSHTVLGRVPVTVLATAAALHAPAEVWLDTPVSVAWTGPDNPGDYITLVMAGEPDGKYGLYTQTNAGSPLKVTAPAATGAGELRYMTGQGGRVLARRPIQITQPPVSMTATAEAVAGAPVEVAWSGPGNPGDYITVVARGTPDGRYGNYATLGKATTVALTLPMTPGDAELRYMTGGGGKVLGRRPIRIVAANVSLSAPPSAQAGSNVSVVWTGPANSGDYITIVAAGAPIGSYGPYTLTGKVSPLTVTAPKQSGPSELRYISGQGSLTLASRPILITE